MNKKYVDKIQFIITFLISVIFVYLIWIGSQYVVKQMVNFDYVDYAITTILAWYITRDTVIVINKLKVVDNKMIRK